MERKRATDFDPQLLALFDKYVHGHISRREFLDGASSFAVGGVTATVLWEMLRPNYALAQQVARDDKRIRAEYVMYPSPQGNSSNGMMRGLLARPATGNRYPAVVVVHENRGLNPYIYRGCRPAPGCRRFPGVRTGCPVASRRLSAR